VHPGSVDRCVGRDWSGKRCDKNALAGDTLCGRCRKCRAVTEDDTSCQTVGSPPGARCWRHKDKPLWIPKKQRPRAKSTQSTRAASGSRSARSKIPRKSPAARRRDDATRSSEIADMCSEILTHGGADFVFENASKYVSEEILKRVATRHRSRDCIRLAKQANAVLKCKDIVHTWLGDIVYWLLGLLGFSDIPRMIMRSLVRRFPIPMIDLKAVAVARALRIIGIWICFQDHRELTRCVCLRDMVKVETKARIKKLLTTEWADWASVIRDKKKT